VMKNNNNPFSGDSTAAKQGYRYLIWEPLGLPNELKPADKPKALAGSAWDWTPDYKSITLTLRDGVKWSDGTPLTADDVVYSFQLMKDKKTLNQYNLPISDVSANGKQDHG